MPGRTIEWNPNVPDVFAVYSYENNHLGHSGGGKFLKLIQIKNKAIITASPSFIREDSVFKSVEVKEDVTCLSWLPSFSRKSSIMAYGNVSGSVNIIDWDTDNKPFLTLSLQSRKSIAEIAWNCNVMGQLAVGGERSKSDCCAVVYDINVEKIVVEVKDPNGSYKLSNTDSIASLCWLPHNENVLALGNTMGWMKIHDIRKNSIENTVMAHTQSRQKRVKGIIADPFNQNIIATFSDSSSECLKIWDLRKIEKSKDSQIFALDPHGIWSKSVKMASPSVPSVIIDATWSPVRANVIAVATTIHEGVGLFSTTKPLTLELSSKTPLFVYNFDGCVKQLSWRGNTRAKKEIDSSMSSRMLVGTFDKTIWDMSLAENSPLAYGGGDSIATGCGNRIIMTDGKIQCDSNSSVSIDSIMKSRCANGYSVDSLKNLQILIGESDLQDKDKNRHHDIQSLQRVWEWIDRIENISELSFDRCGALQLLDMDNFLNPDIPVTSLATTHPLLGCKVYLSFQRSLLRVLCGWGRINFIEDSTSKSRYEHVESLPIQLIVDDDVNIDENFEKAVALAIFHGDPPLAVDIIQRNVASHGSENLFTSSERFHDDLDVESTDITTEYLQLLSLVAMCIAGFNNGLSGRPHQDGVKTSKVAVASNTMWASMCELVISQLNNSKRAQSIYLSVACQFLLDTVKYNSEKNFAILAESRISFSDKMAFAATFLSESELKKYLWSSLDTFDKSGNLEGLLLTGLSSIQGLNILQKYIDQKNDIQTVALLVARIPGVYTKSYESHIANQWIHEYRCILNRWQSYLSRAALDVEMGILSRKHARVEVDSRTISQTNDTSNSLQSSTSRTKVQQPSFVNTTTQRSLYQFPLQNGSAHVLLKCFYCSSSLPPDSMHKTVQSSNWLRRQRPIMNCCPNCKKALPRCYVCLSYLGLLNPQVEVRAALARKKMTADIVDQCQHGKFSDDKQEDKNNTDMYHNVLEFGHWFMWCQHCKHGGHAGCIDDWFGLHDICGVNGCDCHCCGF